MSKRTQLPPQPNLKNLKNQAKSLLKSLQAGDRDAIQRIKVSLPRLSTTSEGDILGAGISLQEVQHVIAREHGFKNWNVLQAIVEVDFDLLTKLDRRSTETLLREVSIKDCIIALSTASEEVKDKLLGNMSTRHRNLIESESSFLEGASPNKYAGAVGVEEIWKSQRRILQQLAESAEAGDLVWPTDGAVAQDVEKAKSAAAEFRPLPHLVELARRPLEQLSIDESVELWKGLAEQVKREGVLSLESFIDKVASPLIREGLQLAVDGTEPDLTRDILETRIQFVLGPQQRVRSGMIIEGLAAIRDGDNPHVVRHKLDVFFTSQPPQKDLVGPKRVTASELVARLRIGPLKQMSLDNLADFFMDMSYLSRSDGMYALEPLQEALEDVRDPNSQLLYCGLELVLDQATPQQIVKTLKVQMAAQLEWFEKACKMVVEGASEMQPGVEPEKVEEAVRQAAM